MLLDRDQGSASRARQWTKSQAVDAGLCEEAVSVVELLAGELIANAIQHVLGGGEVSVETWSYGNRFGVIVFDASAAPPVIQPPAVHGDCGRGLALVDALATDWGYTAMGPESKAVWFFLEARHARSTDRFGCPEGDGSHEHH